MGGSRWWPSQCHVGADAEVGSKNFTEQFVVAEL